MATTPLSVYMHVVEDVINNVRDEFQRENFDENVLNELKSLWELKMMQSEAVNGPTLENSSNAGAQSEISSAPSVQDLNIPYEATDEYEPRGNGLLFPHAALLKEPARYQYMPPRSTELTSYPEASFSASVKVGKPALYMQQPTVWSTKTLPDVDVNIAYQEGQDEEDDRTGQPTITKDFFNFPGGKRKHEDLASTYFPGKYIPQQDGGSDSVSMHGSIAASRSPYQDEKIQNNLKMPNFLQRTNESPTTSSAFTFITKKGIPQLDGVNDNYDNDAAEEDYNEAGDEEPPAANISFGKAIKFEADESDSEPPLNEDDDDDDSGDIDQGEDELKTDHVVLAQFEKVTRTKNKWKCILKDGIMNLNGKDFLFTKGNGEFDF